MDTTHARENLTVRLVEETDSHFVFVRDNADLPGCDDCGSHTDLMLTVAPSSADPSHGIWCLDHVDFDDLEPIT